MQGELPDVRGMPEIESLRFGRTFTVAETAAAAALLRRLAEDEDFRAQVAEDFERRVRPCSSCISCRVK